MWYGVSFKKWTGEALQFTVLKLQDKVYRAELSIDIYEEEKPTFCWVCEPLGGPAAQNSQIYLIFDLCLKWLIEARSTICSN